MSRINCLFGEYWSEAKPKPYPLSYFDFTPEIGGPSGSGTPAKLTYECVSKDRKAFLDLILNIKLRYPFSLFIMAYSATDNVQLEVGGWSIYDFDFHFALEIEKLIATLSLSGEVTPLISDTEWIGLDVYRPAEKDLFVDFPDVGFRWHGTPPDSTTGLQTCGLRIDTHHALKPDLSSFVSNMKDLLNKCSIEYMDYKALSDNYSMFVRNGRQGLNGAEINISDMDSFEQGVTPLLVQYGFIFGHKPGWWSERAGQGDLTYSQRLNTSEPIVIKDERHK